MGIGIPFILIIFFALVVFVVYYAPLISKDLKKNVNQNEKIIHLLEEILKQKKLNNKKEPK
jgi:hypothetical protein